MGHTDIWSLHDDGLYGLMVGLSVSYYGNTGSSSFSFAYSWSAKGWIQMGRDSAERLRRISRITLCGAESGSI